MMRGLEKNVGLRAWYARKGLRGTRVDERTGGAVVQPHQTRESVRGKVALLSKGCSRWRRRSSRGGWVIAR